MSSLVTLVKYDWMSCGCQIGIYRINSDGKLIVYVEAKGKECQKHSHRRNHVVHDYDLDKMQ